MVAESGVIGKSVDDGRFMYACKTTSVCVVNRS